MSLGFAVGTLPGLKLDRAGIAVVGAVATACDRIAYPVRSAAAIDWTTIILLFAMMMIVGILKVYGFFRWLSKNVVARTHTSHHRIATFILLSRVLSAFIVNDIIRVAFTSLVLRLCRRIRIRSRRRYAAKSGLQAHR